MYNLIVKIFSIFQGWVFMPVFHNLRLVSSYEYLELRFNPTVKILCSSVYTLSMMPYIAIVVYTPALALETVLGLNVDLREALEIQS